MAAQQVKIAELDATQLEHLKALETEIGKVVVAVQPEVRLAKLSEQQMSRLQAVESELGVVLLAYEK